MRSKVFLTVAALAASLCCAAAHAGWITYDASLGTLPDAQGWTLFNTVGNPPYSSIVTDQGMPALYMNSTLVAGHYHVWRRTDMDFDFLQTGFTLEATLKMVQGHSTEAMVLAAVDRQGRKLGIRFDPHNALGGRIHVDAGANTYVYFDTTDDYHNYRFVVEPGTGLGTLSIDGNIVASNLAMKATSAQATRIDFGDGTSSAGGEAFFRNIAFLPVPEPTSAGLLLAGALAGLMAFGRRRRGGVRGSDGCK